MEKDKKTPIMIFFSSSLPLSLSLARPSFRMTDAMINDIFGSQWSPKIQRFLQRQIG